MAAIPHFPGARWLGDRHRVGKLEGLPERDILDGLPILHPRVVYVPRIGPFLSAINGPLYFASLAPHLFELRNRFDIVLGAFLFPDAWAAKQIARLLGLPYVVKAHGTDVNVTARSVSIRPFIRNVLQQAQATIAVSRPMLDTLVALGAPRDHVVHVPNGVDRYLFRRRNRDTARKRLGLPERGKILLFVGRLEKEKGLDELLAAFHDLQQKSTESMHLIFVGDGSYRDRLARQSNLVSNIEIVGARPPEDVAWYLAAANLLVLPSWAEGTPNVILEALAAGRPIVATHVGGIPDVVRHDQTGLLVPPKDVPALATALHMALHRSWSENEIVATAPPDWEKSGDLLYDVLATASSHQRLIHDN